MSRRERRIAKKKRKRMIVLSLLACLLMLLGGIYTVDDTMKKTIEPQSKSNRGIFSFKGLGQASDKYEDIEKSGDSDRVEASDNNTSMKVDTPGNNTPIEVDTPDSNDFK